MRFRFRSSDKHRKTPPSVRGHTRHCSVLEWASGRGDGRFGRQTDDDDEEPQRPKWRNVVVITSWWRVATTVAIHLSTTARADISTARWLPSDDHYAEIGGAFFSFCQFRRERRPSAASPRHGPYDAHRGEPQPPPLPRSVELRQAFASSNSNSTTTCCERVLTTRSCHQFANVR